MVSVEVKAGQAILVLRVYPSSPQKRLVYRSSILLEYMVASERSVSTSLQCSLIYTWYLVVVVTTDHLVWLGGATLYCRPPAV